MSLSELKFTDKKVMLLYLNKKTFQDDEGRLKEAVLYSLDNAINVVMVHEQDVNKGYCAFEQLFLQTPKELLARGLYNDIAIPLYRRKEYNAVSMRLLSKKLNDCISK